jgi:hypothetical protein
VRELLSRDGFVNLPGVGTAAIYVLVWGERIVYVGQSTNVFARICSHRNRLLRYKKGKKSYNRNDWDRVIHFDRVWVRFCAKDELDYLELEMIRKYNPEVNILLRRHDIPEWEVDLDKIGLGTWKRPLNESPRVLRRI